MGLMENRFVSLLQVFVSDKLLHLKIPVTPRLSLHPAVTIMRSWSERKSCIK